MLKIAVVDENPFIARLVGQMVQRAGHRALIRKARTPQCLLDQGVVPDLVLIGQRSRDEGGWDCFNHWQDREPGLPLMLYVLDDCRPGCMGMFGKALDQAVAVLGRLPRADHRQQLSTAGPRR